MQIDKLVEKTARTAETYWHFHDYEKSLELVGRIWWIIHSRYFAQREALQPILLRHCSFAFTQSALVPDSLPAKAKTYA